MENIEPKSDGNQNEKRMIISIILVTIILCGKLAVAFLTNIWLLQA